VENLNDVVFSLDSHGTFTYISQRIETLTGYSPRQIVGERFSRFVHPDDRAGLENNWQQTIGGKGSDYKFRILTRQGVEVPVRTSSKVHMEDGKVVSVTGILTERSEHRGARDGKASTKKDAAR
jgi:PAS domain S-box-containing protein